MKGGISMKTVYKFLLPVLSALVLCGCAQSRQVENQSYVIVLGVDENDSGGIKLTAKIPVLSSSSSGNEPSAGDSYKQFSSSADTYSIALEKLHVASPRNLNLSQVELLVLSETLTEKDDFRSLIEDIAQTERLYTAAYTVICSGKAEDFVNALEPAVGSRLSLDIPAIFENYAEQGLIPVSTLADLYYSTESIYSDPVVANAELTQEEANAAIKPYTGTHINGSRVFSDGVYKMDLSANESILANLMRNEVKYFRYEIDGSSIEAAPYAPAKISVDLDKIPAKLMVRLRINVGSQEDLPDVQRIKDTLIQDTKALIQKAQQYGAEPFGFAASAAAKFPSIEKWLACDWENVYKNAEVEVSVSISRWDA